MAKTSALGLAILCVVLAISPITVRSNSEKEILLYSTVIFNGPMANIVVVAGPGPGPGPLPPIESNVFGVTKVIDLPLTESPDSNGQQVGRLQGVVVNSSKDGTRVYITETAIIERGRYKEGTLQIQGSLIKDGNSANGEAGVPSGTGAYRFMGGYVVVQTVRQTPNNAVVSLKFRLKEFDD